MKQHFAALLAVLLALALATPAFALGDYAPETEPGAEAAYIVNLDTNLVVYEKNSETPVAAASLTKMMTMLLMLQDYQDQLDTVTVTAPAYIYNILIEYNGSTADIWRGETHTLRSLLYAMEVQSGNEAAYIVADFMGGGSLENFIARMNSEAEKIGCTGTTFTDPCGLEETNVTTARDAYLILRALMEYDAYVQAAGAATYQMPGVSERHPQAYALYTTNLMLRSGSYYRAYNQGGKTGSLTGWQSFAGWHTQNGESYISVVLHSPITDGEAKPALKDTADLMDWVFETFSIAPALDTTQPSAERPIRYSTQADTVMIYPADDMQTLLPRDGGASLVDLSYNLPEYLTAPIRQGDVVGTVTLSIQGEKLGTVELIAGSTVERNQVLYTVSKIGEFFSSTYFKVVVILTMCVIALCAFVWVVAVLVRLNNTGAPRRK